MNKNQMYAALLALGMLHFPPSFAANATERSMIRSAMYNKLTTAAQMIEHFKTLARNGEEQLINLYIPTFVDRLKKEAAEGALSQPQIDGLRTDAINAIKLLRKDTAAPISKLNNLTAGITTTQQIILPTPTPQPTPIVVTPPEPTPVIQPVIIPSEPIIRDPQVTRQEFNNYINALIDKMYKDSDMAYARTVASSEELKNTPNCSNCFQAFNNIVTQSNNFAAAIERSFNAPITAGALLDQANEYKQRLLDLLTALAANDMGTVNSQVGTMPTPITTPLYPSTPTDQVFTLFDYYNKQYGGKSYQTMLQDIAWNSNKVGSVTKTQIDSVLQSQPVTQQDRDASVNILMQKIFTQSMLRNAGNTTSPDTTANAISNLLATGIYRAYSSSPLLKPEQDNYKQRIFDILISAAANNMPMVDTQLSQLPAPHPQGVYTYPGTSFTYASYINTFTPVQRTFSQILQELVRNANLLSNLTRDEIDAIEAGTPIAITPIIVAAPAPTPVESPLLVTQQDMNAYVNALVRRMYQQSNLRNTGMPNPEGDRQSINFATAIRCYDPNVLVSQSAEYKQRLLDIMKDLAANDIPAVNTKLAQLPNPIIPLAGLGTRFSSLNYLTLDTGYQGMKYADMLQALVRESNIFANVTKDEMTALVQSVP